MIQKAVNQRNETEPLHIVVPLKRANNQVIRQALAGYFRNTTQLCDHGTGSPKSVTTCSAAFLYQE